MTTRDAAVADEPAARRAGFDAVAVKPARHDLSRVPELPLESVVLDFEGREHVPDAADLAALADAVDLRVTTPLRADGFDPLGDDAALAALPDAADPVLVAGHPAYLTETERQRSVAPRLGAAVAAVADPWIGTERMERLALAAGGTQFELLDPGTEAAVRSLRDAGFEGGVAVYAPTVLADDEDAILDAVGDYAARREPVRAALPKGAPTGASAAGRAREVLSRAVRDYALVGDVGTVRERVAALHDAGVTHVVAYPASGLEDLF